MGWSISYDLVSYLRKRSVTNFWTFNRLSDHMRKVVVVKSHSHLFLSLQAGKSASTRTACYLHRSTEFIPPSAYCFRINPMLTGSFSMDIRYLYVLESLMSWVSLTPFPASNHPKFSP